MRKTLVVAAREYNASVRSKSFLISLVLMPVLMSGSLVLQQLTKGIVDTRQRTIAVVDRTTGTAVFNALRAAAESRNKSEIFDKTTGRQTEPAFRFELLKPLGDDEAALIQQRIALSDQVRGKNYFAFIEIGRDVFDPPVTIQSLLSATQALDPPDNVAVRYFSNSPTYTELSNWLQKQINQIVISRRFQNLGLDLVKYTRLAAGAQLVSSTLVTPETARQKEEPGGAARRQLVAILVPVAMVMLMFVIVVVGASPMTANVIEEKQLRIAEVLLGSISPFELMLGKLLGGVGVAVTLSIIYLSGAYYVAMQQNVLQYVSPAVIAWFVFFVIIGTFMYGSLFVAAGSAVTNVKEAQSLVTPVMLVIVLPLFVLTNVIQSPSGPLATAFSFFPLSAPMITVVRIAIPPGIPAWQAILSAVDALIAAVILVWCAGRIFRVGILIQGQGAKFSEMLKWIIRG